MTTSPALPPSPPERREAAPQRSAVDKRSGTATKLTWGLILIGLGLVFTAYNLDWLQFELRLVWEYWPLILVAIGLAKLIDPKERDSGGWLILIGLYLLVNTLHLWGLHWLNSWSLLLIVIGLMTIFKAWRLRRSG